MIDLVGCCSVLQCVALRCSVLQCVVFHMPECLVIFGWYILQIVAVCCSVMQVVAGRCGLGDGGCVTLRWYSW